LNKDGVLDKKELVNGLTITLKSSELAISRVNEIFTKFDINSDGTLDMNEFLNLSYKADRNTVNKIKHKIKEL